MANSEQLRANKKQHKPKNIQSKNDDKLIYGAMKDCIKYLEKRLGEHLGDYELVFKNRISYHDLIKLIKNQNIRHEFDTTFLTRTIIPDGGVILLKSKSDEDYLRIILVSEVKKQGTNDKRISEGKNKQAQGNAIERLGKNLTGIRAALNHEPITPFVCFRYGCDFTEDYGEEDFVMSKISMLNEFYRLNKTYIFKKDGSSEKNMFAPVSMYFRQEEWSKEEMFKILKEIGETSLRYYLF